MSNNPKPMQEAKPACEHPPINRMWFANNDSAGWECSDCGHCEYMTGEATAISHAEYIKTWNELAKDKLNVPILPEPTKEGKP